jgi:hypothetical protein
MESANDQPRFLRVICLTRYDGARSQKNTGDSTFNDLRVSNRAIVPRGL